MVSLLLLAFSTLFVHAIKEHQDQCGMQNHKNVYEKYSYTRPECCSHLFHDPHTIRREQV